MLPAARGPHPSSSSSSAAAFGVGVGGGSGTSPAPLPHVRISLKSVTLGTCDPLGGSTMGALNVMQHGRRSGGGGGGSSVSGSEGGGGGGTLSGSPDGSRHGPRRGRGAERDLALLRLLQQRLSPSSTVVDLLALMQGAAAAREADASASPTRPAAAAVTVVELMEQASTVSRVVATPQHVQHAVLS